MKNFEIVNALNSLNVFVEEQRKAEKPLLSVKGQFAIKSNSKVLMENYKPYEETLNELDKEATDYNEKVKELLECDVDINIKKITEEDFLDGITVDNLMQLDFMTTEGE